MLGIHCLYTNTLFDIIPYACIGIILLYTKLLFIENYQLYNSSPQKKIPVCCTVTTAEFRNVPSKNDDVGYGQNRNVLNARNRRLLNGNKKQLG